MNTNTNTNTNISTSSFSSSTSSAVSVIHMPGVAKQLSAYSDCGYLIQHHQSHTWIAFIDLDEFIILKNNDNNNNSSNSNSSNSSNSTTGHSSRHNTIGDLLDTVNEHAGGLALNWFLFDFHDQIYYEELPVTQRFQRRDATVNQHVKIILRADNFQRNKTVRQWHEDYFYSPHAFRH